MTERIHLDYTTLSLPSKNAIAATISFFEHPCRFDKELVSHVKSSYKRIQELFGADDDAQFVFTSSGKEAESIAASTAFHLRTKHEGRNHFIATEESALSLVNYEDDGAALKLIAPSSRGFITKEELIDAISPRTAMVSLSWASGSTGVMQPLEEIAEVCEERAIWLHVDATHVIGKIPISFSALPIDILTFSGHTIDAPCGTGGLFAKKMIPLRPIVYDAPFNAPLFMGLGEAAFLAKDTESLYMTEVSRLRDFFESGLEYGTVLYKDEERISHISALHFEGIDPELLAFCFYRKGLYVDMSKGYLTCSLSKNTQEHELERALSIINETVKKLRRLAL